jgi:hypothetical protein
MKKITIFIFIITFTLPNLVLASWWNPLTWFSQKNNGVLEQKDDNWRKTLSNLSSTTTTPQQDTKFYIKYDNSRIRSCQSTTNCAVIGTLSRNYELELSGSTKLTLDTLPEWIVVNITDGRTGYINRTVLSESPIVLDSKPSSVISQQTNNSSVPNNTATKVKTLEFIDASIKTLTMSKNYFQTLKNDVNEIKQSTKDRRDFITSANIYNDTYLSQLADIDGESIKKYDSYSKAFDNGIYFTNSTLEIIQKYKDEIMSGNLQYDLSTYNTLLYVWYQDTIKIINSVEGVWNDFTSNYDIASKKRDSVSELMKLSQNKNTQTHYSQILSPGYLPSVPAIPALPIQKIINCSFSSVGGMTPGAGSMTCY